ncbi:MAG TPA: hypothetical protein VMT30_06025 [Candidatus Saccharimonadia bacterium]|nr:hypothetical protein [Candidatus Saccharimonadia bacterium]
MGSLTLLLGTLAGLITAGAAVFKKTFTVPDGCQGINFRNGRATRERTKVRRGTLTQKAVWEEGEILVHTSGKIVWGLPGRDKLRCEQIEHRSTDDRSFAVEVGNELVYLTRINMVHRLTREGLIKALCQAPQTYAALTSNFFHGVVGDVLSTKPHDGDREKLRRFFLEAAQASRELLELGVDPTVIVMAEFSPGPQTQMVRVYREFLSLARRVAKRLGVEPEEED